MTSRPVSLESDTDSFSAIFGCISTTLDTDSVCTFSVTLLFDGFSTIATEFVSNSDANTGCVIVINPKPSAKTVAPIKAESVLPFLNLRKENISRLSCLNICHLINL